MPQSRRRRPNTVPHRTYWSPEIIPAIDAYQAQHQIASFSAAAEALVRLGLQQSPTEIITPIITHAIQHAVQRQLDRLMRVQIYTAIDAGMAQRFAAAAVRDVGRLKGDPPERYQQLKTFVRTDTRRRIARGAIGQVLDELAQLERPPTDDEETHDGTSACELPDAQPDHAPGAQTGRPLLHDT